MGFFSTLFGNSDKKSTPSVNQIEAEPLKEIKENDFIDNSDPNADDSINTKTITYGSSMPIDLIYQFLKEDYETKGYEDALCNPDNSYKEMNKTIIRNNLEVRFKQVKLKYMDDVREIDFHIQSRAQAGLVDVVELLKARKQTLTEHQQQLEEMERDLKNGSGYMIGMLLSYERGFLRGLAALSLETLKSQKS